MYELERRIIELESRVNQMVRVGTVSSLDAGAGTVRVLCPDADSLVSYSLPVLVHKTQDDKHYFMPDVGEHVLCVFLPIGLVQGFVVGSFYSDKDAVPVSSPDKTHITFKDGTVLEYDRDSHILTGNVKGYVDLTVDEDVTIKVGGDVSAQVDGNVTAQVGGDVDATVNGSVTVQVDGNVGATVGGNISAQAGGDIDVQAEGSVSAQAGEDIEATADGNISADAGGNIDAQAGGAISAQAATNINLPVINIVGNFTQGGTGGGTGTETKTVNTTQTGNFTLTGNLSVTGNITATGTIIDQGGNTPNHTH